MYSTKDVSEMMEQIKEDDGSKYDWLVEEIKVERPSLFEDPLA